MQSRDVDHHSELNDLPEDVLTGRRATFGPERLLCYIINQADRGQHKGVISMPSAIQISRDEAVLLGNSERWRAAMGRMGKIAVEAELRRRPGRPSERVLDIGNEAPYPTREFCEQWCIEQDNILFRFSPRIGVVLALFVLLLACVLQVYGSIGVAPIGSGAGTGATPNMARADAPRAMAAPPGIQSVPAYQPVTAPQSLPLPSMQQNARAGGSASP